MFVESIGKSIEGKFAKSPATTTEYIVNNKGAIIGMAASYPTNMWMLWGLPHKLIVEPDGSFMYKSIFGGSLCAGKHADYKSYTIVEGSCATCTCCCPYAIAMEYTDELWETRKKKCCAKKVEVCAMQDIDKFIADIGLVAPDSQGL